MTNRTSRVALLLVFLLLVSGCETGGDQSYADQMAEQHEDDTTAATPIASEPAAPVEADTITYGETDGRQLSGYMATPAEQDGAGVDTTLPGLIVIHEWWGLNDNIRLMARKLAGEGYRALAVDLYGGRTAETPDEARELVQEAMGNEQAAITNLEAAHAFLEERHGAPRVGIIGWCFGGTWSLRSALALPERLDAAVMYYGHVQDADEEQLRNMEIPLLGFFGREDESIPIEAVREFEQTLTEIGKDVEVHVYENAGHAFANPSGNNFVPSAAQDAWSETTAFLREHLQPPAQGTSGG